MISWLWNTYFGGVSALAERLTPIGPGPVWTPEELPWLKILEQDSRAIRSEVDAYLARAEMPDKEDLDPGRTAQYGRERWQLLHLITYGEVFESNARHFPITMAALRRVPGLAGAMFSRLPPERHDIPAHSDAKNGTLRAHLGLKVPPGACFIGVADHIMHWREGEAFALDASYRHFVRKDAEEERILLIVDFIRPVPAWLERMSYDMYVRQGGARARRHLRESYRRLDNASGAHADTAGTP